MNVSSASREKRILVVLGRAIIILIPIFFLGQSLISNWKAVQQTAVAMNWGLFILSSIILAVAFIFIPLPTYFSLRSQTKAVTPRDTFVIYFMSQLAKYLPGGLWAIPGRAFAYQQRFSIQPAVGFYLVIWEVLTFSIGAFLIGILNISPPIELAFLPFVLALALMGLVGGMVCFQFSATKRFIANNRIGLLRRLQVIPQVRLTTLSNMTLSTIPFWIINGIGFYFLIGMTRMIDAPITWTQASSIFAMAWLTGFLVFVAPAGLGVRESILVLLLQMWITPAEALVIALIARFWWTVVEAMFILFAVILLKTQRETPLLSQEH